MDIAPVRRGRSIQSGARYRLAQGARSCEQQARCVGAPWSESEMCGAAAWPAGVLASRPPGSPARPHKGPGPRPRVGVRADQTGPQIATRMARNVWRCGIIFEFIGPSRLGGAKTRDTAAGRSPMASSVNTVLPAHSMNMWTRYVPLAM